MRAALKVKVVDLGDPLPYRDELALLNSRLDPFARSSWLRAGDAVRTGKSTGARKVRHWIHYLLTEWGSHSFGLARVRMYAHNDRPDKTAIQSWMKYGPLLYEVLISFLGKIARSCHLIAAVESLSPLRSHHTDGPKD